MSTPGGGEQHLSADGMRLYGAIARQDWPVVDEIVVRNPQARQELLGWGLVHWGPEQGGRPVVRDPDLALRELMERELEQARARVDRLSKLPALADELGDQYRAVQLRAGGSSEYLGDAAVVNSRIRDVVGGAQREILAAQPGGPRRRELLELAVERDMAALDRGVDLRTIYRDTVRDDVLTAEYAKTMSTRTGGRRAEYRTLVGSFVRMIIVDREQAFVPDLIVAGSPEHSAWHVTDRAVVAVLAEVFDTTWRRAAMWHGELRPRVGRDDVDTVSEPGKVATTPRQREIMRCLVSGMTQAAVARKIGVPKRTLEDEIAALKRLSGADTAMQLAYWWAHCPDSHDTAKDRPAVA
ncbi:hypothetical protein [Streptomyces chartreusis]|uniref:hypothetical protein n=1 Tax=Streptomyces chartreusis TaxID=1969 RepID=UPI00364E90F7